MNDNFNKALWDLGKDNPELREAIAHSLYKGGNGYSIPTRQYCSVTEEVEDIHTHLLDIEDPEKREKLLQAIKKVDSMTIGQLAKLLNYARVAYLLKEARGEKLTEPEKTLKDIDITMLALNVLFCADKVIGRKTPIETKPELQG